MTTNRMVKSHVLKENSFGEKNHKAGTFLIWPHIFKQFNQEKVCVNHLLYISSNIIE